MPSCYILRGLPGSGKSKLKSELIAANDIDGLTQVSDCSADNYFYATGKYEFKKESLSLAHESCWKRFMYAVTCGDHVIVDNTNTRKWEYEKYLKLASDAGYIVTVLHVETDLSDEELAKRNIHGVTASKIKQMRERFEY